MCTCPWSTHEDDDDLIDEYGDDINGAFFPQNNQQNNQQNNPKNNPKNPTTHSSSINMPLLYNTTNNTYHSMYSAQYPPHTRPDNQQLPSDFVSNSIETSVSDFLQQIFLPLDINTHNPNYVINIDNNRIHSNINTNSISTFKRPQYYRKKSRLKGTFCFNEPHTRPNTTTNALNTSTMNNTKDKPQKDEKKGKGNVITNFINFLPDISALIEPQFRPYNSHTSQNQTNQEDFESDLDLRDDNMGRFNDYYTQYDGNGNKTEIRNDSVKKYENNNKTLLKENFVDKPTSKTSTEPKKYGAPASLPRQSSLDTPFSLSNHIPKTTTPLPSVSNHSTSCLINNTTNTNTILTKHSISSKYHTGECKQLDFDKHTLHQINQKSAICPQNPLNTAPIRANESEKCQFNEYDLDEVAKPHITQKQSKKNPQKIAPNFAKFSSLPPLPPNPTRRRYSETTIPASFFPSIVSAQNDVNNAKSQESVSDPPKPPRTVPIPLPPLSQHYDTFGYRRDILHITDITELYLLNAKTLLGRGQGHSQVVFGKCKVTGRDVVIKVSPLKVDLIESMNNIIRFDFEGYFQEMFTGLLARYKAECAKVGVILQEMGGESKEERADIRGDGYFEKDFNSNNFRNDQNNQQNNQQNDQNNNNFDNFYNFSSFDSDDQLVVNNDDGNAGINDQDSVTMPSTNHYKDNTNTSRLVGKKTKENKLNEINFEHLNRNNFLNNISSERFSETNSNFYSQNNSSNSVSTNDGKVNNVYSNSSHNIQSYHYSDIDFFNQNLEHFEHFSPPKNTNFFSKISKNNPQNSHQTKTRHLSLETTSVIPAIPPSKLTYRKLLSDCSDYPHHPVNHLNSINDSDSKFFSQNLFFSTFSQNPLKNSTKNSLEFSMQFCKYYFPAYFLNYPPHLPRLKSFESYSTSNKSSPTPHLPIKTPPHLPSDIIQLLNSQLHLLSIPHIPHTTPVLEVLCDGVALYTVIPAISGPTLFEYLKKKGKFISQKKNVKKNLTKNANGLALSLMETISNLEHYGVLHNDIKPDNILWGIQKEDVLNGEGNLGHLGNLGHSGNNNLSNNFGTNVSPENAQNSQNLVNIFNFPENDFHDSTKSPFSSIIPNQVTQNDDNFHFTGLTVTDYDRSLHVQCYRLYNWSISNSFPSLNFVYNHTGRHHTMDLKNMYEMVVGGRYQGIKVGTSGGKNREFQNTPKNTDFLPQNSHASHSNTSHNSNNISFGHKIDQNHHFHNFSDSSSLSMVSTGSATQSRHSGVNSAVVSQMNSNINSANNSGFYFHEQNGQNDQNDQNHQNNDENNQSQPNLSQIIQTTPHYHHTHNHVHFNHSHIHSHNLTPQTHSSQPHSLHSSVNNTHNNSNKGNTSTSVDIPLIFTPPEQIRILPIKPVATPHVSKMIHIDSNVQSGRFGLIDGNLGERNEIFGDCRDNDYKNEKDDCGEYKEYGITSPNSPGILSYSIGNKIFENKHENYTTNSSKKSPQSLSSYLIYPNQFKQSNSPQCVAISQPVMVSADIYRLGLLLCISMTSKIPWSNRQYLKSLLLTYFTQSGIDHVVNNDQKMASGKNKVDLNKLSQDQVVDLLTKKMYFFFENEVQNDANDGNDVAVKTNDEQSNMGIDSGHGETQGQIGATFGQNVADEGTVLIDSLTQAPLARIDLSKPSPTSLVELKEDRKDFFSKIINDKEICGQKDVNFDDFDVSNKNKQKSYLRARSTSPGPRSNQNTANAVGSVTGNRTNKGNTDLNGKVESPQLEFDGQCCLDENSQRNINNTQNLKSSQNNQTKNDFLLFQSRLKFESLSVMYYNYRTKHRADMLYLSQLYTDTMAQLDRTTPTNPSFTPTQSDESPSQSLTTNPTISTKIMPDSNDGTNGEVNGADLSIQTHRPITQSDKNLPDSSEHHYNADSASVEVILHLQGLISMNLFKVVVLIPFLSAISTALSLPTKSIREYMIELPSGTSLTHYGVQSARGEVGGKLQARFRLLACRCNDVRCNLFIPQRTIVLPYSSGTRCRGGLMNNFREENRQEKNHGGNNIEKHEQSDEHDNSAENIHPVLLDQYGKRTMVLNPIIEKSTPLAQITASDQLSFISSFLNSSLLQRPTVFSTRQHCFFKKKKKSTM